MSPKGRWIKSNSHMWVFVAPDGSTHLRVFKTYMPELYAYRWLTWPYGGEFYFSGPAKRHAKERLSKLLSETEALR